MTDCSFSLAHAHFEGYLERDVDGFLAQTSFCTFCIAAPNRWTPMVLESSESVSNPADGLVFLLETHLQPHAVSILEIVSPGLHCRLRVFGCDPAWLMLRGFFGQVN